MVPNNPKKVFYDQNNVQSHRYFMFSSGEKWVQLSKMKTFIEFPEIRWDRTFSE